MFSNVVTLKSGGYIVVNQTEALVAIDVNSGRSTREHNIEDTALRTNLEAADEVARQLRLRDLAGLIVVDFIDMEEYRNNRSVERRMKEALKNDRARIQVGRISHFGLLEMSRQRMRTGVLEGSSVVCPHCMGAGTVRSTASIALHVLRLIEDSLIRNNQFNMVVRTRTEVALYILNQKRAHLRELEERFGVTVVIGADDTLTGSNYHVLERGEPVLTPIPLQARPQQIRVDTIAPIYEDDEPAAVEEAEETESEEAEDEGAADGPAGEAESGDRRRRRRRRRGGRNRESSGIEADAPQPPDDAFAAMAAYAGQPAIGQPAPDFAQQGETEGAPEGEGQEGGEAGGFDPRNRRNGRRRRGGRGRDGEFRPRFANGDGDGNGQQNGTWVRTPDPDQGQSEDQRNAEQPAGTWAPASLDAPREFTPPEAPPASEHQAAPAAEASAPSGGYEAPRMNVEPVPAPVVETPAPAPAAATPAEPVAAGPATPEAIEKRVVEALPEAPPPAEKKGGWWQRARNAISGN
jgi:ribonuclease E